MRPVAQLSEALVQCFVGIAEGIDATVLDMSNPEIRTLEDMNSRARVHLDAMVSQAMEDLRAARNNQQGALFGDASGGQGVAIELF